MPVEGADGPGLNVSVDPSDVRPEGLSFFVSLSSEHIKRSQWGDDSCHLSLCRGNVTRVFLLGGLLVKVVSGWHLDVTAALLRQHVPDHLPVLTLARDYSKVWGFGNPRHWLDCLTMGHCF